MVLEMTAAQQTTFDLNNCFDLKSTLAEMQRLDINEQAKLVIELNLEQATEVLTKMPLGDVQDILEVLEDTGQQLKARELSAHCGLMISESELTQDYFAASVTDHVRARIGWIISLSMLGIVSGMIIASYEDALSALVVLAVYMPVMADTGGNVGSQSATLLVRSLATGEVKISDWGRVLWTEFRVSVIMAAILMAVIMIRVVMFGTGANLPAGITMNMVGVAVASAMAIQVVSSTVMGSMLPILARSMRLDPALLVSPVLTSIVDITGMLIYFYITTTMLGL